MHRIASQPGEIDPAQIDLIEQPGAPILFLSSASTDISTISHILNNSKSNNFKYPIRALLLSELFHPAQIDHYLSTTASEAKLIFIRLLGDRSYWSYGFEQLINWKNDDPNRNIVVISGIKQHQQELEELSSVPLNIVSHISTLINNGGSQNMRYVTEILALILENKNINLDKYIPVEYEELIKWDWNHETGYKVLVILYNSLLKSNDLKLATIIKTSLIKNKLCPRIIWVNSLKSKDIQDKLLTIISEESIKVVLTTTSFATTNSDQTNIQNQFWNICNIPVFQLLTSTDSKDSWENSYLGLNSVDLTLQVVMPEIDGRINTRPIAFKEILFRENKLSTPIKFLDPYLESINWVIELITNWIKLSELKNSDKRITIILANYPIKNGRIANGVGLDTPQSLLNILLWLKSEGYDLGNKNIPNNSLELVNSILSKRTNDPESDHRQNLDYLTFKDYKKWWDSINLNSRERLIDKWNEPIEAIDLEANGFSINGISYGNISILIQPSRGFDTDSLRDLHSPDLPPPHRYLAQYYWIHKIFKANAIIHLGKHGSVEWLPGKGIGLSDSCFPHIAMPPLPHIYPFIVNDPGEGSQAKRRTQAVIIDHLTPPLARAGLYGELHLLETLLDEYYDAKLLSSNRTNIIEKRLLKLLFEQSFPFVDTNKALSDYDSQSIDELITELDSYLCEIKDSQIRTGLHILGRIPLTNNLVQLIVSISRCPQNNIRGITQEIAYILKLDIDPWSDDEWHPVSYNDKNIINKLTNKNIRTNKDIIDYLEDQASLIIKCLLSSKNLINKENFKKELLHPDLKDFINNSLKYPLIRYIEIKIINNLIGSAIKERQSFIDVLNGLRVSSGPSGAPTRGRIDVLPTGRNFFSLDIRNVPTQAAFDLGNRSANQILELYKLENGEDLKSLAISIWATSTMRNGGEDIGQILSLLGMKPIWEYSTQRVLSLEIIPLSILDRPRVDILIRISGLFRDSFPQVVELINNAQVKLSQLDEPSELNPYINSNSNLGRQSRIFGSAPGSYGCGLQELISSSNWENKKELADSYIKWSKWKYTGESNPISNNEEFIYHLSKVQAVIHNQDNKEHDILDSDDYYQFHGGLAASIEEYSGSKPMILIGDHSRSQRPRINSLKKEIDKVIRNRLLNPKWIEGIKKHGYKGAFEIGASIDYLFGYDATTELVNDWAYRKITNTFLKDKNNREFLATTNPWVLRDIAERLLEANNRKLWKDAKEEEIKEIKSIANYADLIIEKF